MIIIGVDTAIRKTGYGVVRMNGPSDLAVLDCGVIVNKASLPHTECLRRLFKGMEELCGAFHPDAASIESAFVHKNIKTAMILSLARGAAMTSLAVAGVTVFEYSPMSAKRALTGRGDATKLQVAAMVAAMGGLDVSDIPDDATDALALAVCHGGLALRGDSSLLLGKSI